MATIFKPQGRAKYVIQYFDENGVRRKATGSSDKRVTEQLAAKLERDVLLRKQGLIDPRAESYRDHGARPLADHLDDWHATLLDRGNTRKHADLYLDRDRRVADLAGAKKLSDLNPAK